MAIDGMSMMLKAMGVDPESLKTGVQLAEQKIAHLESSLALIHAKLDFIGVLIDLRSGDEVTYSRTFLKPQLEGANHGRNNDNR
jgi:hypothetical protein